MTGPIRVRKAKCRGARQASFSPLSAVELLDSAITVKVGDDLKEFSVHQGLVCHFSAFFRGAMRSHCKEILEMPKVEVPTFESQLRESEEGESSTAGKRLRLAKLWVFGDTYGIPDLQNAAIGALRQSLNNMNTMPSTRVVAYVYDNTDANASIRELLLDNVLETKDFRHVFNPAKDKDKEVLWDGQFCQDLLFLYASRYGDKVRDLQETQDAWTSRDECDYHVHYDKNTIGAQTASGICPPAAVNSSNSITSPYPAAASSTNNSITSPIDLTS